MSAYALPDLFHPPPVAFSFAEEKREEPQEPHVGIAVKEAKIDSAILIQSLVQQRNDARQSPQSKRKRKLRGTGVCRSQTHATPTLSSQDALKFELSISFNGRKYTALRSLPSLKALRRDLVEEVDADIPDLSFEDEKNLQGIRSFSSLQTMLQSYIPQVHAWLRDVTQRVSPAASPSLRSFLWEPTSTSPPLWHREDSTNSGSSQLECIEEDETDDDSDDEDHDGDRDPEKTR